MAEVFRVMTKAVEEGEPFELPDGAVIVGTEQIHWSMDGKTRRRIIYLIGYSDGGPTTH